MAGPLRSTDIAPLHRYYEPLRDPLVFPPLSWIPSYTASLLRRFLDGARRAYFEAIWVHLRYGPATRSPSFSGGFVNRLQDVQLLG